MGKGEGKVEKIVERGERKEEAGRQKEIDDAGDIDIDDIDIYIPRVKPYVAFFP